MAELIAENTLTSLIPQCLAAVEILHEFLAKDNFCQLGRERIKSEITSGFYLLLGCASACRESFRVFTFRSCNMTQPAS